MKIQEEAVDHFDGDAPLHAWLAWDSEETRKRPGVFVVHGGAGLDDHAKGRARNFVQRGYVAFACDMYGENVTGDRERIRAKIMELRASRERLCRRALAGVELLRQNSLVNGQLAAVGYCFGGMTVLELARSGARLDGVVSVHGGLETAQPAEPNAIQAKVLVCHGALDPHVPITQLHGLTDELTRAGADWQVAIYGGAEHGYTHEENYGVPGVAYNAQADARTWRAIDAFFGEIFGPSA